MYQNLAVRWSADMTFPSSSILHIPFKGCIETVLLCCIFNLSWTSSFHCHFVWHHLTVRIYCSCIVWVVSIIAWWFMSWKIVRQLLRYYTYCLQTGCKFVSGVGLLQHYIRIGKTRDDIVKITYHFCVNLNIQPARVCEGITELFGVCCEKYKFHSWWWSLTGQEKCEGIP